MPRTARRREGIPVSGSAHDSPPNNAHTIFDSRVSVLRPRRADDKNVGEQHRIQIEGSVMHQGTIFLDVHTSDSQRTKAVVITRHPESVRR
jgi:hypothetical protein